MPNHSEATDALRTLCNDQLPRRYGRQVQEDAQARLNEEWKLIDAGHAMAFQIAAEVSRFTTENEFRCKTIGAGSCSIITYLLNLSEVDPIEFRLPAQRLLALRKIKFMIVVDPEFESRFRSFGEKHADFEQTFHIHLATRLEIIPNRVADLIRRNRDPKFDVRQIPKLDLPTTEFFRTGDFGGFFQLESEEVQLPLRELKTRSVKSLAAILTAVQISAARDGFLEEFVERASRGHVAPRHQFIVSELLRETHGLLLYQEQIMLVLHRLGGIALEDGYEFVKQAAKRNDVEAFRQRFLATAVGSKVSKDEGETLIDELEQAAGYALCKPHQLANAITTWQSAYLKTHFRREFEQVVERIAVGSR